MSKTTKNQATTFSNPYSEIPNKCNENFHRVDIKACIVRTSYKCTVDIVQSLGGWGEDVCMWQAVWLHSSIYLAGTGTRAWAHAPHRMCQECKCQRASSSKFGFAAAAGRGRKVMRGYWFIPLRKGDCAETIKRVWVREEWVEAGEIQGGRVQPRKSLMLCVALGRAQGSLPFSLVPNTACKLRHWEINRCGFEPSDPSLNDIYHS